MNNGNLIYSWAKDLFPINRSLTGDGVRETLQYIKNIVHDLQITEIPTDTKCFDWTIPKEWNCTDAYIITPNGDKICDFKKNNLHLIGYSIPTHKKIEYDELLDHLYYLKNQPTAIPYVTSYYKERWGFALSYEEFQTLQKGTYTVVIDSELKNGSLTYGEVYIKGTSNKEIFLSTYICHPSMANNEISGPTVTTALIKFIKNLKNKKYSYRIIFIPETIGSICYISQHLKQMKQNIIAGFNITCVGDNNAYSYIPTRYGNTLSDKVAKHILEKLPNFVEYSFLDRGSDESHYCAPGIDLPIPAICRTKFGKYKEYHTSLDNLDYISPEGLYGAYKNISKMIELLERNEYYKVTILCEPQLGKRGLYPTISTKNSCIETRDMMNFLTYADGTNDLIDIANIIGTDAEKLFEIIDKLYKANLIEIMSE